MMVIKKINLPKPFYNTFNKIVVGIKTQIESRKLSTLENGSYLLETPPYVSQIANADRTRIDKFYGGIKDQSAANRFGSEDLDDFGYWAWRSCGIVAAQMAIQSLKPDLKLKTRELVEKGVGLGGYNIDSDTGWYHFALAKMVRSFGLQSKVRKFVSSPEIAKLILNKEYVLASVKSSTGGHIFLIYGFRIERNRLEGFFVHDPNNFFEDGKSKFVQLDKFNELTTNRVITVYK